MANEVLQNLPPHNRKNAEYVMKKLAKSQDGWTPKSEFVYMGKIVKGLHMINLFKNLSGSYKTSQTLTPKK